MLSFDITTLPTFVQGIAYTITLTASNAVGPITWSVSSGSLPTGITLTNGGLLSGSPTILGNVSFNIQATDGTNTVTQAYAMQVVTDIELTLTRVSTGENFTVTIPTAIAQIWDYIAANMLDAGLPIYTVDGTHPNGLNVLYRDVVTLMVPTWQTKYSNLQTQAAMQQIAQSIASTVQNVTVTKNQ